MKKFGVLFAFSLAACISTIASRMIKESDTSNSPESSATLMDLPVELRLNIFEQLDFYDLVSLSKTHPVNCDTVAKILRNFNWLKFSSIFIGGEIRNKNNVRNPFHLEFDSLLFYIRNFGHLITKLEIGFSRNTHPKQCRLLNQYIDKYVAKFVNVINLELGFESFACSVNDLTGPFPKVENVTISRLTYFRANASDKVDTSIQERLPVLFPALRDLAINRVEFESLIHLPHLERLTILDSQNLENSSLPIKSALERLTQTVRVNTQIRHLSLDTYCTWDMIKTISEHLPNLSSLKVFDVDYYSKFGLENNGYEGEIIRFTNMSKFEFHSQHNNPQELPRQRLERIPLEFGNLEHIEYRGEGSSDNLFRIIMDNPNLKKIIVFKNFNDQQLQEMAEKLLNLEEFGMFYNVMYYISNIFDAFPVDGAVRFMRTAKKLQRVAWRGISAETFSAINEQVQREWFSIELDTFTRR